MSSTVRAMGPDDIPRVLPLITTAFPCMILTEESMRWRADHPHPEFANRELLAVDRHGAPVGFVRVLTLRTPDEAGRVKAYITLLSVHEDVPEPMEVRAALLHEAERTARADGATAVRVEVADDGVQAGGSLLASFVHELGYTENVEEHRIQGLDLRSLPEPPPVPAGVELRPFTAFTDDPRPLYEVDREATGDEPGERQGETFMPYAEWLHSVWPHPLAARDISTAVLVGGEVVGFTAYVSDRRTRLESQMTGTLAAHRGRGLAGLAKTTALHRARERGIRFAYTGNHDANAPMLAINSRLGYRVVGAERTFARPEGQA
ncbi:GNAT family N-acetyltransferase [Nocardiopsis sp. HNM0947]|uniref:GNAT family N-acetyltransferase n=1 Tax=Nocardiopsis coralli TaxID=2772213 RepID=A0ABR9P7F0_9ACTN|nr:GNAT family N-acetyltransferase [Nocardiopsis coralli]MBE2999767.1 GNAT family N-acetyltransferase [Nocardiopsis coralli]